MKSKIFISLNIPSRVKKRLISATEKWQELPIKWTKEQSLHLTLVFLGFVHEDVLPEICEKVGRAVGKNAIFDIAFDRIGFFPSEKEPRAVALLGEASEELRNLVNDIEKELGISSVPKKSFCPHITLGRMRKIKWESLPEKPEISEKFSANLEVTAVDIMASNFDMETGEYATIESCPLV